MKLEKQTELSQLEKNKLSALGQALYQFAVSVDSPAKSWMMLPAAERADWALKELKIAAAAIRKYWEDTQTWKVVDEYHENDRPVEGQLVLVAYTNAEGQRFVREATFRPSRCGGDDGWFLSDSVGDWHAQELLWTHWMPMPELPEASP